MESPLKVSSKQQTLTALDQAAEKTQNYKVEAVHYTTERMGSSWGAPVEASTELPRFREMSHTLEAKEISFINHHLNKLNKYAYRPCKLAETMNGQNHMAYVVIHYKGQPTGHRAIQFDDSDIAVGRQALAWLKGDS